ncbi:hypothetical protein [Actinacidiphila oryziradicis]|uniref:Uncharacterized protein n=1 Tax=Actinacidiphila oryziradicis TaxID=2571141 RepID=A0A4U0SJ46_9ACTN|nr:hypothetical protein [Actinacidiphila oryziradicis]TKA00305.1 hypothetical protein FCI23_43100 [Actinacidiphila oryziradicis]
MDQPQWVARDQAVSRRVIFNGRIDKVVDYFGGASPFAGPQAYLVEQRNYVLRPHFHPVDQFQILYGAPGALFGRWPVGGLVAHYADAHTVYGPLTGGDPPLRYFTLRAEPTQATEFMPESRALLPQRAGRSLHRELGPAAGDAGPAAAASSTLLEDERDGLWIGCTAGEPGAMISVPEAGPGGQFLFVVAGAVESAGAWYPPESIGWQPCGSGGWAGTAGSDGVRILVLRYPRRAGTGARPAAPDTGQRPARFRKGDDHE